MDIFMQRGGYADFKALFCNGAWPEYGPPFSTPHQEGTPPFDSHAYGVYGQGYLNLSFPLIPNLSGTQGHRWMQDALRPLKGVDDTIYTTYIPLRSYLTSIYYEVTMTDETLDGVYITPVAARMKYDFTVNDFVKEPLPDFTNELTAFGIEKFPLGTPAAGDKLYGIAMLSQTAGVTPCTFGHNIVTRDKTGAPTGGADNFFGAVLLGYKIAEGDPAKIATIWRSNIAVYMAAKLSAFECPTQIG